ncbi:protein-L-isoaspartate(D-aspartate) O-methyltransferase [Pedobacter sp. SYSU D00535]|uniref:protein-L-isoaspartate(D-aspartate) O-methyltransferase n=1 Tax=Pedobacter sp. SYSU D00535 TaxID=2810308 RepID=UPI001A97A856|nr:protein-L-isoaspartate(D-aspartate) O-methyltransferase [Pedobacter sp. SYSU D00535]
MKLLLKLLLPLFVSHSASCQNHEELREKMVRRQLEGRGIKHEPTLKAMGKVERHRFIPVDYRDQAYEDTPLPIGYGQTISQPYVVATMTELIQPRPGFRVLEIGAGSGYQAAVLAEIVDSVYTIEIVKELGERSRKLLKELGYNNVRLIIGDGYKGLPEKAPFDAILVTAAPEEIPPALIEQLKEGGKMVIPVGPARDIQSLKLVEKRNGKLKSREVFPVRFVPFTRKKD